MQARMMIAVGAAVLLSACANEKIEPLSQAGHMNLVGAAYAAEATDETPAIPRKTLASKVLSAIALEAVTGLKADPARLGELD